MSVISWRLNTDNMFFLSFNSVNYLFFLLIITIFYYFFPYKYRWTILLLASTIFYISAGIKKLPFIVFTSLIVYLSTKKINAVYEEAENTADERRLKGKERMQFLQPLKKKCRNTYVIPTIIIVVLQLCYCKCGSYVLKFIQANIYSWTLMDIVVPLGISYYTFSSIGYILDTYWRKQRPIDNFFKYLLCVSYFPQIVQGPIARYNRLADEIFEEHSFDYKQVCFGLQLMLYGYFKKLVIADRLALFTQAVFENIVDYEGLTIVIALIFSTFQLYTDFSGCMDIVRGTSQVFGIKLDHNFNHPFFSKTAAEFWRRWHITLGTWFKDYIYMPIVTSIWLSQITNFIKKKWGKDLAKKVNAAIPLAVVWLLTGLWHGTGWNYIAWGIYWGLLIIVSTIFAKQYKRLAELLHINTNTRGYQRFQMLRTFLVFTVGRLITVPGSLRNSVIAIKQIFTRFNPWIFWDGTLYKMGLDYKDLCVTILGLLLVYKISLLQEKGSVREMIAEKNILIRWMIYYIAIFSIIILGMYGVGYNASDFIYANF